MLPQEEENNFNNKMTSLMGWSSLVETGTSMIKVLCSYSFFNWAVTFLGDMFLSYEALLQLLYKDWLHLYRVTRTLLIQNYYSYFWIDASQRGYFSFYQVLTIYTSSQFTHMRTKGIKSTIQQIWWFLLCSSCMLGTLWGSRWPNCSYNWTE